MEVFFLGVTEPHWLTKTKVPLFLSRKRLLNDGQQRKTLPRARGIWAMDSGGFTELSDPKQPYPACYRVKPEVYAAEACRYMDEIGKMAWAAVQDWMCECKVLRRTGLTIRDHQLKTIESLFKLRAIAPQVPWTPVLQGWEVEDYENHVALYHENGVDLRCEPVVGLGTVCSRQATKEAEAIVQRLSRYDLRLHLFGFKSDGLPSTLNWVVSADSDAWSFVARTRRILLPGHVHPARKDSIDKKTGKIRWRKGARTDCRNCLEYALHWREEMLTKVRKTATPDLAERFWGHRPPTRQEIEEFQRIDPAEGQRLTDTLLGDYDAYASKLEATSRRQVLDEKRCHYLGSATGDCEKITYVPPRKHASALQVPPQVKIKDLPRPDRAIMPFVPWAPRGAKLEDRAPHPPYPKRRRRKGEPLPGQEALLVTETDTGLGAPRISPFREENESVPRALRTFGLTRGEYEGVRVQTLDWPFLLGTGWKSHNEYAGWDHLKDWEILDMYEGYPEIQAMYESWFEDGFPAVVLVRRGSGKYKLMDGDDQAQLAYAMGRPGVPALLVTHLDQ